MTNGILLGSETYEITVTCSECGRIEVMYVPTEYEISDIQRFLYGRGWTSVASVWLCDIDEAHA